MDEQFEKELRDNGAGVDDAISRFMGNKALYQKFLIKFKDDHSYEAIVESIDKKDYKEAFNGAHTLKGVSANLGLDPIYKGASGLTELLRGKRPQEIDEEEVNFIKEELGKACCLFREIIKKYE